MSQNHNPVRRSVLAKATQIAYDLLGALVLAWLLARELHDAKRPHAIRWTTKLAGKTIFDVLVEPDTLVIMPVWLDTGIPNVKTQWVVYTRVRDMRKYLEQPMDKYGWVWYYDGGRKHGDDSPLLDRSQTNVSTWKQAER